MHKKLLAGAAALAVAVVALAQQHDHSMQQRDQANPQEADTQGHGAAPPPDGRQVVHFPQTLREHTLANMRDHLLALQQIQEALSAQDYDKAAEIAEKRLGMTAMKLHGAHEVAKHMPQGMQDIGAAMHHSASQFAMAAQESAASGDIKPAVAALSRVTANCVACHVAYRVQ